MRPIDNVYDPACIDYITTSCEDLFLKGAKSEEAKLRFARNATPIAADTPILARGGSERAPRLTYLMPSDFVRLGYTIGRPGCVQMQKKT